MSNIKKAFANGKAFIPFITCGDPDLETTAKVVRAMATSLSWAFPFPTPPPKAPSSRRPTSGPCPPEPPPIKSSTWCGTCGGTSPSPWCS